MSLQAVMDFREKVNASDELQARVRSAFHKRDYKALVQLGEAHNCVFTEAELKDTMQLVSRELSAFEMELVAAGSSANGVPPTTYDPKQPR